MKKSFQRIIASMLALILILGNITSLAYDNESDGITEEILTEEIDTNEEELFVLDFDENIEDENIEDEIEIINEEISTYEVSVIANNISVEDGEYEIKATSEFDSKFYTGENIGEDATAVVENGVATYTFTTGIANILGIDIYMTGGTYTNHDGVSRIEMDFCEVNSETFEGVMSVTSASDVVTVVFDILQTDQEKAPTTQCTTYITFDWQTAVKIEEEPEESVKTFDVEDGEYEIKATSEFKVALYTGNNVGENATAVVKDGVATYTFTTGIANLLGTDVYMTGGGYINHENTISQQMDFCEVNSETFEGVMSATSASDVIEVVFTTKNVENDNTNSLACTTYITFDWQTAVKIEKEPEEDKVADGIYELPMFSAYYRYHTNGYTTDSDASMSNNAINHKAIAVVNGDNTDIYIQFKGMSISTIEGHLLHSYYYPQSMIDSGVLPNNAQSEAIEMETLSTVNDIGLYNEINEYISHLAFEYDANAPENVYIRVWVDAMEGLESQHAVLVFDWENANKISDSLISLEISSTKHQTYYNIGDEINLSNLQITSIDTDRKTEVINVTSDMISGFDTSEEGIKRVTISYKGFETVYAITVIQGDFTVPENTEKYIATDVIAYQYHVPDELSMCNGVFSGDAEVEITGETAVLKLYVANPTPTWGGLEDGILKDMYITHDGVQYDGVSVSGYQNPDAPIREYTQDSSFFGINQGDKLASDVITFEIPAEALKGSNGTYIHLSAFVNLVMNSTQQFYLDIKWNSEQVVVTPVSIEVNSTSHITSYQVGDALNVSGLTISVTMDDGTTQQRNVTASMITGFNSTEETDSLELLITYEGLTTTFEIEVLPASEGVVIGNGTYTVPVYIKKYTTVGTYSKNSENSMASEAIVGYAMATVSGDNITYTMRFAGIELSGLYGHLLNMYHYSKDDVNDGKLADPIPSTIVSYVDDAGLNGDIEQFPEIMSIKYSGDVNDNVYIYTYVDAMIGFNYQNAVLVFDWEEAIFDNGMSALDGYYQDLEDDYELTATITKDAIISRNKAYAYHDADEIISTINAFGDDSYDATIILNIEYDEDVESVQINVPRDAIEAIIHRTSGLVIKTPKADIQMTNLALYSMSQNMPGDFKFTIKDVGDTDVLGVYNINQGRNALDFTINIGMKTARYFQRSITVKIPYNIELGEVSRRLGVHYIEDEENSSKMYTSSYSNGYMIFETNHFSTFAITYQNFIENFTDVKDYHWFAEAIETMIEEEIFTGITDTIFSPNGEITREMFMTVLYRLSGETVEVNAENGYQKSIDWAVENRISDGTNPEKTITREEIVTMLHRFAQNPQLNDSIDKYSDSESVSDWAVDAQIWANSTGIVEGKTNSTLNPQDNATRAEVSTMLMRFLQN